MYQTSHYALVSSFSFSEKLRKIPLFLTDKILRPQNRDNFLKTNENVHYLFNVAKEKS